MNASAPIPFGLVGTGWRAEFYLRIAAACPEHFRVVGLTGRTANKISGLGQRFGVPTFDDVERLVRSAEPLFVVTSVSWEANPSVLESLTELGMPVLSETPPATTVREMEALCARVRAGARIQVAEQYFLQPHHAARLAFAQGGRLGRITQAQVSAAHGYHGISLLRRFLGVGFANATIRALDFTAPLVAGPRRGVARVTETIVPSAQRLAWLEFDDQLGVFDFTGDQYSSPVRQPRLLLRGERGELHNDTAVCLRDHQTPLTIPFLRHEAGRQGNLEGLHLKGIQAGGEWVYHNPVAPARLFDDEIAIASSLLGMAAFARGGPEVYSLAEACQDRYLDLLMDEAATTGQTIRSETRPWAPT